MPWEKPGRAAAPIPIWEKEAPKTQGPRMPWEHKPLKARSSSAGGNHKSPTPPAAAPNARAPVAGRKAGAAGRPEGGNTGTRAARSPDRQPGPAGLRRAGTGAGRKRGPGPTRTSALESSADGRWQPRDVPARPRDEDRDRESRLALDHLQLRSTPLWNTWERLSALGQDLQTILPSIVLKPLKLEKQTLVVTAASSAMAARLRQYEPRLLDGLQARGWLVSRIRFKPSTVHAPPAPAPRPKDRVPGRALDAMQALADTPDLSPALRESLQRFIRRQRSYWEG